MFDGILYDQVNAMHSLICIIGDKNDRHPLKHLNIMCIYKLVKLMLELELGAHLE